jgi:hypothetical protein
MRISSILDGSIKDENSFAITMSGGGNVTVIHPSLGEMWQRGAEHQITWSKTILENVKVDLCNAAGTWISTLKTSSSSLSLNWYIPWSQTPGSYTIRVSSILDPTITDLSDIFTISLNGPGTVTVTAPNGGEIWGVGSTHMITWTKTFTENIKLELCDAAGNPLKTLKTSTEALSFNWYIPYSQAPGNYRIKATSIYDPADYDLSDATFQIAVMDFVVFPNPVTGSVMTLKFTNPPQEDCTIEVFDRFGARAFTVNANVAAGNDLAIPASALFSDIYFIVVTSGDLRVTKKIVVQH